MSKTRKSSSPLIGLASSRDALFLFLAILAVPLTTSAAIGQEANQYTEPSITSSERAHWSFEPLNRLAPPSVPPTNWSKTSIDSYILARLEKKSLSPLPPADRTTLIRRLAFDLIGLPPSPEEVGAFVDDPSPDAYERLVDRLLGSPHFGERWAQHWLDLARFAETDGFEHDKLRPDAWRYRDWVIRALDEDMPYDRFVALQLAGDELEPGNQSATTATSFCLSGPDMPDINSMEERKHNLLNELTATVGSVFLGLQFGCAQCHDHKFDPISQGDFYRLRAIFEPAVHLTKNKSVSVLGERDGKPVVSRVMIRGDWRRPGPVSPPGFPRIANSANEKFTAAKVHGQSSGRRAALARWLTRGDNPLAARVMVNRIWQHHLGQGLCRSPSDFGVMGDAPSHPQLLDWLATELVRRNWSLKHIHRLIVTSSVYRQASRATTPGWDDEQRRAAQASWQRSQQSDPANVLLARFPRRRLEGETIRDAMLCAAGVLNKRRGGPGVRPPLSKELVDTLLRNQWNVSPDRADHDRRSIYILARRNLRYPIFDAFDRPDANASCAARGQSTTAPQSLFMINSEFSLSTARRFAGFVLASGKNDNQWLTQCFERALNRKPTPDELDGAHQFIKQQSETLRKESRPAEELALPDPCPVGVDPYVAASVTDLCLAPFNSSEFIYID